MRKENERFVIYYTAKKSLRISTLSSKITGYSGSYHLVEHRHKEGRNIERFKGSKWYVSEEEYEKITSQKNYTSAKEQAFRRRNPTASYLVEDLGVDLD